MQGLKGSRESVEKGCSSVYCVREGVDGGDGEVAAGTPVTENGEEGEGLVNIVNAISLLVASFPSNDEESDSEGVE